MSKPLTSAEKRSDARAKRAEADKRSALDELFRGASENVADWSSAGPGAVLEVIIAMSSVGGAVTFGLSRDGGAYMLTFLLDGSRKTEWLPCDGALDAWLENATYLIRTLSDK